MNACNADQLAANVPSVYISDPTEASQYQRRMEAKMREYKRNLAGLEAAGSPVTMDLQNMSIRYQRLRQEYIKFSKSMGLPTQFERTGV